jgi:SAM-dependent methyltransferase
MRDTGQKKSGFSPFDDLAAEYDAWFDGEGSLIFLIEARSFREVLHSLSRPWLEIGVGSGRFAGALGIDTGIDPSEKLVEMARRRGINVFVGRGERTPFDNESFGTAFLIVTLCFLDNPLEILKEANRILVTGGKLVLGLVLKGSPWGRFYQAKKEEGHRFYKFATFYTPGQVARLMVRTGFLAEKMISTLFQKPGEVRRMEEPRNGYFEDGGFTIIVAGKLSGPESQVTP